MKLNKLQAEAVWATLVAACGADAEKQDYFVRLAQEYEAKSGIELEYRFGGNLGFGGKVYLEDPPRVSCYPEDETSEMSRMIQNANKLLSILVRLWRCT